MKSKFKINLLILAVFLAITSLAVADDTSTNATPPVPGAKTNDSTHATEPKKPKQTQADVASATASFGKIAKTDDAYKSAVDAHALGDALKLVDKDGAFKGTVAKIFEPRGLAIVEFDENYKTALTALVKGGNFTNFPALTNLIGKDVVVTGKFIKYRDSAEIVLTNSEQVKIVQ